MINTAKIQNKASRDNKNLRFEIDKPITKVKGAFRSDLF
jgi:hypothetical protein